jgi:2-polyprenyl-3-methyl-5-hydroxy-6-metoxy-1,4-benzoquinol methylase
MSTMRTTETGSGARWGPLWGAHPADWALTEDMQRPTYEAALQRTGLEPGWRVLDIGCGAGAFPTPGRGRLRASTHRTP